MDSSIIKPHQCFLERYHAVLAAFHQQQIYYIEESLEQPIFLNPCNKLNFSSNNPYFYDISPKNITDKFIAISDFCRFHQPTLIS